MNYIAIIKIFLNIFFLHLISPIFEKNTINLNFHD